VHPEKFLRIGPAVGCKFIQLVDNESYWAGQAAVVHFLVPMGRGYLDSGPSEPC